MVRYLLLPDDEREFWSGHRRSTAWNSLQQSRPRPLTKLERLSVLSSELPGALREGSSIPRKFVLRDPDWGSNDLDPWDTDAAEARVMRSLNTGLQNGQGCPSTMWSTSSEHECSASDAAAGPRRVNWVQSGGAVYPWDA